MHDDLRAFLQHLAHRRSPRTVKTYGTILATFVSWRRRGRAMPWTTAETEAFLARPCVDGTPRSPATQNQELAALRAFSKFARREFGWPSGPTDGVPFAREAPIDPPILSAPELRRVFMVAAEESMAQLRSRNLAILALLSQAGLRVHELVGLDLAQLDFARATLVAVHGKGNTVHDLPLNAPTVPISDLDDTGPSTSRLANLPGECREDALAGEVRERDQLVRQRHRNQGIVVHAAAQLPDQCEDFV